MDRRTDLESSRGDRREIIDRARDSADQLSATLTRVQPLPNAIPGYEIVREVRRGGQGVVYRAIQDKTARPVAIKIMHEGPFAGSHGKARFEREVRLLARLKHPNIVTIHESGTASGSQFFVMDWIAGQPLDVYSSGRNSSVRKALELFRKICEAVNAAHLRGIIHRDLKPSNILIDADGEPHVLDFGLAKTEVEDHGEATGLRSMTMTGQFIGSLPWASPEQADGSPDEIDLRTDVYSLGVVLYQSLTGQFPYAVTGRMREALGNIIETEPVRPRTVRPDIDDEVETIILKCLAKEPDRRYQSAGELALDIRRYLGGEPIEAKCESTLYVLRKQIRRFRVPLLVVASFVLLLILSSVIAWSLYMDSQDNLWQAHLASARAHRTGGQPGRRFEALDAVANAAAIRPSIELRNEAIAAMTLFDVRPVSRWDVGQGWVTVMFDAQLEHFALLKSLGQVSVRQFTDGREILSLGKGPGPQVASRATWIDFGSDGSLMSRCAPSGCEVWDLEHSGIVGEIRTSNASHSATDFSPDGGLLALGTRDGAVMIHNLRSHETEVLPSIHAPVYRVRFHPTQPVLATVSLNDNRVLVRDIETGEVVRSFTCPKPPHSAPAWTRDGSLLAVGCDDLSVHVWETQAGQHRFALKGHIGIPVVVGFDSTGHILFSSGWDGMTRLWDAHHGSQLFSIEGNAYRFAENTPRLGLHGDLGRTPTVAEIVRSQALRTIPGRSANDVSGGAESIAVSPNGRVVLTGSADGLRFWDMAVEREIAMLPVGMIESVHFHPHEDVFFAVGDREVWRWPFRIEAGVFRIGPPQPIGLRPEDRPSRACLSADGTALVVTMNFDHALVFDAEGTAKTKRLGPQRKMFYVAISPGKDWAATGTYGGEGVKVWDLKKGVLAHHLPVSMGSTQVAASPDGKWLVTSHDGHTLWDTISWKPVRHFTHPAATYVHQSMAFSPDGLLLGVVANQNTIELVNLSRLEVVARLESPDTIGMAEITFTPDGMHLVHPDPFARSIHIWDLRAIREGLAEMNLDWDLPPYPPAPSTDEFKPLRVEVDLGELAPLLTEEAAQD